jgi:5-methylcytosine-specific restriction protein B
VTPTELMADFASFRTDEESLSKANALRQQFVERFPIDNILQLSLKQYALGADDPDSFCQWLEFKTVAVGSIGGAVASKHVVFYSKKRNEWVYPAQYNSETEALEATLVGISELIRLASKESWSELDGVEPFTTKNLTRGKILYMYYPDSFIPIFAPAQLGTFCDCLGIATSSDESATMLNRKLVAFRDSSAPSKSTFEFAAYLYKKFPPSDAFWKIAPGEKASQWPDCKTDSFICIGWDDLGDLREFVDDAALKTAYAALSHLPGFKKSSKVNSEIIPFRDLKLGDRILANRGLTSVIGLGKVNKPYFFDDTRGSFKHCVGVDWYDTNPRSLVPLRGSDDVKDFEFTTVKDLTRMQFERLAALPTEEALDIQELDEPKESVVEQSSYSKLMASTHLQSEFFQDCEHLLLTKKQIILQGVPGTGKTFVADKLATWWADSQERTEIVQFHENYGYEDFMQGIRPEPDDTGSVSFRLRNGVFMEFCEKARSDSNHRYVLIIDEINRAKPTRVFGELLYLLEYRDKKIRLQSGDHFSIPPNVFLIATMNTIDRSIALVDYALRRRFAFLSLAPIEGAKTVVLRKWLSKHEIQNADAVDQLFLALNQRVSERDPSLMVGHSYFMDQDFISNRTVSDDDLKHLWRYYIMPLLGEYEYELSPEELQSKYGLSSIKLLAGL